MIEVEAKVRVKDIDSVRNISASLGKFVGTQVKIDDYYTLEDMKKYPKKSLRVRKKDDIYEINFKHLVSDSNDVVAKKEVEFKVEEVDKFLTLIHEFGFKKWVRKEKLSEIYQLGENFHIELNNLKGVGWFAEVEYLATPQEIKSAQKQVLEVIKKLGFKQKDIIKEGYTKMLWKTKHK